MIGLSEVGSRAVDLGAINNLVGKLNESEWLRWGNVLNSFLLTDSSPNFIKLQVKICFQTNAVLVSISY